MADIRFDRGTRQYEMTSSGICLGCAISFGFGSTAKRIYSPDYPWAPTSERRVQAFDEVERNWTTGLGWEDIAPSLDAAGLAELSRYYRRCASPGVSGRPGRRGVVPRRGPGSLPGEGPGRWLPC